ncbi:MAG: thioredoxin family protein [Ignavibacteriaceae bacterium]|nr:thioredoxin family protein [Ignavibacterium sp.]MCC6254296.1 thioredoxin family protein [Ignavibacteriaceae bacterium]HMN24804.1 thioredoxin family protein [Ignavibacteriaceae bacterium]HRN27942.1 thioredoxin family protein [Ignavibacteriaceae bacterium]HRP92215.1 thioredoxin family protein [Ignavibacteriaceae bacterium]
MKKIILSAVLLTAILIGCSKGGTNDGLNWEENLETALQKAKTENKAVLVNFTGSDWCQWCIKLSDEVFSKSEFKEYADDNLILVRLDFPRNIEQTAETKAYNNQLAKKYGVQGFPTVLLFSSSGNLVKTTGYMPGGPVTYVSDLKSAL